MKGRIFVIVLLVIAAIVFLVWGESHKPVPQAVLSGNVAPAFTLMDVQGKPVSLASEKGKVVLVNFWHTWCHICQGETPKLVALQKEYPASEFVILGVNPGDSLAEITKFQKDYQVNYPLLLGNAALAKAYGVDGVPTSFLINRQGLIVGEPYNVYSPEMKQAIEQQLNAH